ncbi:hypothetical protein [Brachyspira hyodysenteriae]|nr:hypothetical protein [Brachyspira hyodysenteriae]MCZ9896260.1 hypothetical protein [Brachyspira hyodysenteriae]
MEALQLKVLWLVGRSEVKINYDLDLSVVKLKVDENSSIRMMFRLYR